VQIVHRYIYISRWQMLSNMWWWFNYNWNRRMWW